MQDVSCFLALRPEKILLTTREGRTDILAVRLSSHTNANDSDFAALGQEEGQEIE
jgi:hypothetical protein